MKLSPLHGIYSLLLGWNTDQRKAWKSLVKLKIPMIQKLSSLILLGWCKSNYLNSLKITSCEMPDWMNHKLESRLPAEIWTISDMQMLFEWQKGRINYTYLRSFLERTNTYSWIVAILYSSLTNIYVSSDQL